MKLILASIQQPITLIDIKEHLRLEIDDISEDSLLIKYILVATDHVENIINRRLMYQTWKYYLDTWPYVDNIELPYPPLVKVVEFTYKNINEESIIFPSDFWFLDTVSEPGKLYLKSNNFWPAGELFNVNPISIKFKCGYGATSDDVPEPYKMAIKFIVAHFFENRELAGKKIEKIPLGVDDILQSHRLWSF